MKDSSLAANTTRCQHILKMLVPFSPSEEREFSKMLKDLSWRHRNELKGGKLDYSQQSSGIILGTPRRFTRYPRLSFPICQIIRPN
jgi:hypothetical protein